MGVTNFQNANLRLLVTDTSGILTAASLTQTNTSFTGVAIQVVNVTLNNAQILALPTTPVVVIPSTQTLNYSGFPTTIPKMVAAYAFLDARAGAYTGNPSAYLYLAYGSDNSTGAIAWTRGSAGSPIDVNQFPIIALTSSAQHQWISFSISELSLTDGDLFDNAISVNIDNSGNLTGGNAANTMKVTVYYVVASL